MTEAQKRSAYLEAQQILRLDKTWQHVMPGERKPNFRRAAREIIRRALGHKVTRNEAPLNLHSGLMHEHEPREAALVERTLKNGMYDPSVLLSFQRGKTVQKREPVRPYSYEEASNVEVYLHDHSEMLDYPSHYEVGNDTFHSSMHTEPTHAEVPANAAPVTSEYEPVQG